MEAIFCPTQSTMSRGDRGGGQSSGGMVEVMRRGQAGLAER